MITIAPNMGPTALSGNSVLADNAKLSLGTGSPSQVSWDTGDANANVLMIDLPAGGAVDVPVVAVGIDIDNQDLGHFDGLTQPMVATVDADFDSYVGFHFSGDDVAVVRMRLANGTVRNHTIPNVASSTLAVLGAVQTFSAAITFSAALGGNLDLGNNDLLNPGDPGNEWTANALKLINDNTNGDNLIKLENTATSGTSSATMVVKVDEGSSRNPAYMLSVEASGGDSNFMIALDNDQSDRFSISNSNTVGTNDGFRMTSATPPVITYNTTHPTGTFDYVCNGCGRHEAEMFYCCGQVTERDDVMDFRAMVLRQPNAIDYMELIGVMEQTVGSDGKPEVFTVLGPDWLFVGSMAYQNRQRMDAYWKDAGVIFRSHEHRLDVLDEANMVAKSKWDELEGLKQKVAALEASLGVE